MSSQGFFYLGNMKTFWHCSSSLGLPCLTTFQSSHPLVFCVISQLLVLLSTLICQHIWKTQQWPQDQKRSVFIPIPKKGQCQRMFKLLYNCTHITCYQSNVQNSPSQDSTVRERQTSRCSSWIQKRQRNQRSNCQHPLDH